MIEFTMPALGADMDEGALNEWLVKPGDTVTRGQIVAVVETTKAAVEIECWHDGVVGELLVPIGQTVAVGTPLATILEPGEKAGPRTAAPAPVTQAPPEDHDQVPAATSVMVRNQTMWGWIAWQIDPEKAFPLVANHDKDRVAPGGDVIRGELEGRGSGVEGLLRPGGDREARRK